MYLRSVILLVFLQLIGTLGTQEEYELMNHLFSNYNSAVRPVVNAKDATLVKLGAALQQIIELDQKNQIITLNLWMRMQWHDESFIWNPADFGNTSVMIVPSKTIWRPDIVLYTNADDGFSGMMETSATITSEGVVYWNAPAIYKSTCKIDITYFPFDEQHCQLKFGSWAYNGFQIDLRNRSLSGDTSSYIDNGEWELVAMPVSNNVVVYGCCPEPYPDVRFTVIIRRRPLFYLFNLLLPCIMISFITVLEFYLPADAGEKVTLGITVLLALTVFLLLVAETMPPTSEVVPILSQYFTITIVLVSVSVLFTVYVLSLHFRLPGTKPVPKLMRQFAFGIVAKILCLKSVTDNFLVSEEDFKESPPNNQNKETEEIHLPKRKNENTNLAINEFPVHNERFDENVRNISKNLEFLTQRAKDTDAEEAILTEWKQVAYVFDRLFMWSFMVITTIVTIAILCQKKPFTDPSTL